MVEAMPTSALIGGAARATLEAKGMPRAVQMPRGPAKARGKSMAKVIWMARGMGNSKRKATGTGRATAIETGEHLCPWT